MVTYIFSCYGNKYLLTMVTQKITKKHVKELGNHKAKSTTNLIRFHANLEQFLKHTDPQNPTLYARKTRRFTLEQLRLV